VGIEETGVGTTHLVTVAAPGSDWRVTVVERSPGPTRPASCVAAPTPTVGFAVADVSRG
jgi:hypothetical protein